MSSPVQTNRPAHDTSARMVTTPIYYPNAVPHLGHAYTTVLADSLHRYHKLFGIESLFFTGLDEHGQKVAQSAQERGLEPQAHVDEMAASFQKTWEELLIRPDRFIRTTDRDHKEIVSWCLQKLFDCGDLYKKDYTGWYSVSDELFYTDKDIVNGVSPNGKPVIQVTESNYFFRMSKYQERLIAYFESHPVSVLPPGKMNEVLGFLREPLQDLCISRPVARLSWGIPLPFDPNFVTYVWFDALLNYATAAGIKNDQTNFDKFWPGCIHLVGKDILMTHTIYYPTMLMALDIPIPRTVFAHGWWLNGEGKKMSKSEGDVVSPDKMIELLGAEPFRYFLMSGMVSGNDSSFSIERATAKIDEDLADRVGNLLSRSTTLIEKYCSGKLPGMSLTLPESAAISERAAALVDDMQAEIAGLNVQGALALCVDFVRDVDRYFNAFQPWAGLKNPETFNQCCEVLYTSLESLRIAGILLFPVIPHRAERLLQTVGWTEAPDAARARTWGLLKEGTAISKAQPLFPKLSGSVPK